MVRAAVVELAPPDDLRDVVRCSYEATFDGERYDLIPDGCVDLLWRSDGTLVVCGPETAGWSFRVPPQSTTVGVRLAPGALSAVLGIGAFDVTNRRVPLDEIVGRRATAPTVDRLHSAISLGEQRRELVALSRSLAVDVAVPLDSGVAARALMSAPPAFDTSQVARDLGMSRRHLHRVCVRTLGYGPSMFRRVLRVQRALTLMSAPTPKPLAQIAAHVGFADQPHMTREFRSIAQMTPREAARPRSAGGTGTEVVYRAGPAS